MEPKKRFGGILPAIANEGILSLETTAEWTREIEKATGTKVTPMEAVIKYANDIDEHEWIYAAHIGSKRHYHPIGDPRWIPLHEQSTELLDHYIDKYGIILYREGRVLTVGMLDCSDEACNAFASYFEDWRQFRFFCIGPQEYARVISYLTENITQKQTILPGETDPIVADMQIMIPRIRINRHNFNVSTVLLADQEDIVKEEFLPLRRTGPHLWVIVKEEGWDEKKRRRLRNLLDLEPKPLFCDPEMFKCIHDVCITLLNQKKIREPDNVLHTRMNLRPASEISIADESISEGSSDEVLKRLLSIGISENASDIHLEQVDKITRIRMRIDGLPETYEPIDKRRGDRLMRYIRDTAGLHPSTDAGQGLADSNFNASYENRRINFRLGLISQSKDGIQEDRIVIRILDPRNVKTNLDAIEMQEKDRQTIRRAMAADQGLVLITGPTGSGKSTTLFAMVYELSGRVSRRKGYDNVVYTVEDPIEYAIPNVTQIQINEDIGITFPQAIRGLLRLDPDVILVQEIRDHETAVAALNLSDTGHLVLSTVHTNDCVNALFRMTIGLEANSEQFLNNNILITAQRLFAKRCLRCRTYDEKTQIWNNTGCFHCQNRGRKGRQLIVETLDTKHDHPEVKKMFLEKKTEEEIRTYLVMEKGWQSLGQQILELSNNGTIIVDSENGPTDISSSAEAQSKSPIVVNSSATLTTPS